MTNAGHEPRRLEESMVEEALEAFGKHVEETVDRLIEANAAALTRERDDLAAQVEKLKRVAEAAKEYRKGAKARAFAADHPAMMDEAWAVGRMLRSARELDAALREAGFEVPS